jgi:hypothetical protein
MNADLQRELEELTDKLEMAGGTTVVQSELLKKTDSDLQRCNVVVCLQCTCCSLYGNCTRF